MKVYKDLNLGIYLESFINNNLVKGGFLPIITFSSKFRSYIYDTVVRNLDETIDTKSWDNKYIKEILTVYLKTQPVILDICGCEGWYGIQFENIKPKTMDLEKMFDIFSNICVIIDNNNTECSINDIKNKFREHFCKIRNVIKFGKMGKLDELIRRKFNLDDNDKIIKNYKLIDYVRKPGGVIINLKIKKTLNSISFDVYNCKNMYNILNKDLRKYILILDTITESGNFIPSFVEQLNKSEMMKHTKLFKDYIRGNREDDVNDYIEKKSEKIRKYLGCKKYEIKNYYHKNLICCPDLIMDNTCYSIRSINNINSNIYVSVLHLQLSLAILRMNGLSINKTGFIIPEIPAVAVYDLSRWKKHKQFLKVLRYTLFKLNKDNDKAMSINKKDRQKRIIKQLIKIYKFNDVKFGYDWINLSLLPPLFFKSI